MNSHFFYVVSNDHDYERKVGKGGETEDPYMRLKRYGTSGHKFRIRFLAKIATTDKQLIRKIEKRWLAKFDDVESESEDENDLNHASTIEGISYKDEKEFLRFFIETLQELQLEGLFISAFQTNTEINTVLYQYKSLHIRNRPIQSLSGLTLRSYQIEDIQKTIYAFLEEDISRGYWSIECGLGKTVMAYELLRQINPKRAFFVVPRNTLLHQVLRSFLEWKYPREQLYYCSSSPLPNDIGTLKKVRKYSELPEDSSWLCIITYDSLSSMRQAVVDMIVFDEGHHLVPSAKKTDISGNLFGLYDSNIRSKHRLTITATPKNTPLVENDIVSHIGMSHQPELYGTCLAERNYMFGKNHGFLSEFEVVCIKTESQLIRSMIQEFKNLLHLGDSTFSQFLTELKKWEDGRSRAMLEHIDSTVETEDEEDTYSGDLILWYAIVANLLIQSIHRFNSKKVVTYHTTKKRAELFQRMVTMLWKHMRIPQTMTCDTVHSGHSDELNEQAKARFKGKEGADVRVICNIRTLIEGFDEPSIDTTLFADNKWSAIEAKQIIGRGNRKDPANPMKVHKVIIPFLAYETEETEERIFIRTTNDYKTVRYTVKNIILSHDPNQSISQTVWVPKPKQPREPSEEEEDKGEEVDETERVWIDENIPSQHDQEILGSCPTKELAAQSFQTARLWMHELARKLGWNRFVGESQITSAWNQYRDSHLLPKDIPHDPSKIYRQVGWINMRDYVGVLTKREEWQELHAGEMLELLRSKRIKLFDYTLSTLRTQVESILTRKLPAHPKAKWKISLYDLAERVEPNSTHELRKWGKYPDKLYSLLAKEGITDAIDFERLWPSLHTKYPNIPGIPSEIWDDSFWAKYDPTE